MIYKGHVLDVLRGMPDGSVDCVITSPPFWGLRCYGTNPQIWGGGKDCGHEWNKEQAVDAAYAQIKGLKASVGGYFGGYYDVFIDFTTGRVTWTHWDGGEEINHHKTISQPL